MSECKIPENEQERKQQFIGVTIEGINGNLEMIHEQIRFLKHLGVDIDLEIPTSVHLNTLPIPDEPRNIHITYFPIEQ